MSLEERLKTSDVYLQEAIKAKFVAELEAQNNKTKLECFESTAKSLEDNLATREALLAKGREELRKGKDVLIFEAKRVRLGMRTEIINL